MRKIFFTLASLALIFVFSSSDGFAQQSGNKGRAIAAAKKECGNIYNGQGVEWRAQNNILGLCANQGGVYEGWQVFVFFSCPPQQTILCLPAPPVHVADVTFNCEGEVVVDCK